MIHVEVGGVVPGYVSIDFVCQRVSGAESGSYDVQMSDNRNS